MIRWFCLGSFFIAVLVFYFNDRQTALLITGCALLVVGFWVLPIIPTQENKTDSTANAPHNPND